MTRIRFVSFRLPMCEYEQLLAIADADGETVSDLIREALYASYERRGLGAIAISSPVSPVNPRRDTRRSEA